MRVLLILVIFLSFPACSEDEPTVPEPAKLAPVCNEWDLELVLEFRLLSHLIDKNSIAVDVDINGIKKTMYICLENSAYFNSAKLKEHFLLKGNSTSRLDVNYKLAPSTTYCGNGATYFMFDKMEGQFVLDCENTETSKTIVVLLSE